VERSPGQYDWTNVDAAVSADLANGFQVNPVLLATPGFHSSSMSAQSDEPPPRLEDKGPALAVMRGQPLRRAAGSSIAPPNGLRNPVFADGTDTPAPGKAINPNNPWARFVAAAVSRYRDRVRVWEMWNEPDFSLFWSGSVGDYARLLKVGYLAAKSVDPNVTVLMGGMMYWEWTNRAGDHAWLRAFLDEVARDPSAAANGYYFDAIPWHWYSRSSDVYDKVTSAKALLAARGVNGKRHWVNEMNAPACGEPPANVSCSDANYKGSATVQEQAAFVVQGMAYALAAGADRAFHFQYADDGNGEAFGLFRNDGSARPAYTAYGVAAERLGGATAATRQTVGSVEQIVVQRPSGIQTTVLWARGPSTETAIVSARGTSATLVEIDGASTTLHPVNGQYSIGLAGATNNRSFSNSPTDFIIGGRPRLLVEGAAPTPTPTWPSYGPPPTLAPGQSRSTYPLLPRNGPFN
jgi:hypothetical protein